MADWLSTDDHAPAAGGEWLSTDQHARGPIVSAGASDEDVIKSFGFDPAKIQASPAYQAARKQYGSGISYMLTDPHRKDLVAKLADSPLGDLGQGALDVFEGVSQLARHVASKAGLMDARDTPYFDLLTRLQQQDYAQNIRHGNASGAARLAGNIMVPVPGTNLIKGEGVIPSIARGVTTGATAGAMQPVTEGNPDAFVADKLHQAGYGAAVGGGLETAIGAARLSLGKLRSGGMPPAASKVIQAGEEHGVPLSYGDVTGQPAAQKAEQMLEHVPVVGTSGFRARQQGAAKEAAQKVQSNAYDQFLDTDPEQFDDVQRAAANGDERARQLKERIQNAGNDPDRTLQASIGLSDFRTREQAKSLYDQVESLVREHKLGDVDVAPTLQAVDRALEQETTAKLPDQQVITLLKTLKKNLSPKEVDASELPMAAAAGQKGAPSENVPTGRQTPGAGEGPAIPAQAGGGQETTVRVPGQAKGYQARYAVRELDEIQASHNGQSFEANAQYPYKNDRDYTKEENQGNVIEGAGEQFDPSYHVTDNPDATNGPIVTDPQGNALGGNGRTMILQRVYAGNPKGAAAYRSLLEQKAEQFGLDPAAIKGMKKPVLVRELADQEIGGPQEAQNAITDFNKKGTAALTPAEQALADARRVSPATLEDIGRRLEGKGADATLAQVLEGKGGTEVLQKLIDDGVITPQERAAMQAGEQLTPAGKERISKLLLGRYFSSPAEFDNLPAATRNKLERIAPALSKVEATPGYNLTEHVKEAIDILSEARAHGSTLDDYLQQKGLLAGQEYAPESITLAKDLDAATPTAIQLRAQKYAEHAKYAAEYSGPGMFSEFPEPKTGGQAFNEVWGGPVSAGRNLTPIQPRTVPAPSAAFSHSFGKLTPIQTGKVKVPADNSYGKIRELRSDLGEIIRQQMSGPNAIIATKATARLQPVKNALEADLAALARNSGVPEVQHAADLADEYYRTARVPFRDGMLTQAAGSTEPDQIFKQFIKAGKGDRAQKFYDVLDAKGKAAVKYNIIADAVNQATEPRTGSFSPGRFFHSLDKVKEAYGVFFRGSDRMELEGVKNLMAHVVRAGQFAENPPTGQRAIGAALGAGAILQPVAMAKVAGVAGLARLLLTTPRGRNFLLQSSAAPPGSKMLQNILDQVSAKYATAPATQK